MFVLAKRTTAVLLLLMWTSVVAQPLSESNCTNGTLGYFGETTYDNANCTGAFTANGNIYGLCVPPGAEDEFAPTKTFCNDTLCMECAWAEHSTTCEGDFTVAYFYYDNSCQVEYGMRQTWFAGETPYFDLGSGWVDLTFQQGDDNCESYATSFNIYGDQYCYDGVTYWDSCTTSGGMLAYDGCPPNEEFGYVIDPQYCVQQSGYPFSQYCVGPGAPTFAPTPPPGPSDGPTLAPTFAPTPSPGPSDGPTLAPTTGGNSTSSSSGSSGLSEGAEVGISVSVSLVAVAVIVAGVALWWRKGGAGAGDGNMKQGLVGGGGGGGASRASEVGMSSSSYVPPSNA